MKTEIAYNKISQKLKDKIVWPKNAKGEPEASVVYRTKHAEQMVMRTADDERVRVDTHPPIHIPNMDTILDPYANGDEGEYVQLAYFKTLLPPSPNTGGVVAPSLLPITFATDGDGFLHIPYKNGAGLALYQFMELTNANEDCVNPGHEKNPNGMPYLFSRVKPEATAEKQIDKLAEVARVMGLVAAMEEKEMRILAPKLEINGTLRPKELQHAILLKVQADPYLVRDMLDTEQTKIVAEVERALGRKVIEWSDSEQAFVWYDSRQPLVLVPSEIVDKKDALVTFLSNGLSGRQVRDKIRAALGKGKVVASASLPETDYSDEGDEDAPETSVKKTAAKVKQPAKAKPAAAPAKPRKTAAKKSAAAPAPVEEAADPTSY